MIIDCRPTLNFRLMHCFVFSIYPSCHSHQNLKIDNLDNEVERKLSNYFLGKGKLQSISSAPLLSKTLSSVRASEALDG